MGCIQYGLQGVDRDTRYYCCSATIAQRVLIVYLHAFTHEPTSQWQSLPSLGLSEVTHLDYHGDNKLPSVPDMVQTQQAEWLPGHFTTTHFTKVYHQ